MNKKIKRLYIITGKGGVGKTTLAMALTKHLENEGKKVLYNSFFDTPDKDLKKKLNLPTLELDLFESAETYIGRKLKSQTVASWIMKTSFFRSLFLMIPGLSNMILLGHIIDDLQKDPSLTIVMDSPASGHALTMFESSSNFKKIFNSGLIVGDIDKMHNFLSNPDILKTIIVSLPKELAIGEAIDLKNQLQSDMKELKLNPEIVTNDSLKKYLETNKVDVNCLPEFLTKKIEQESVSTDSKVIFPHIPSTDDAFIVEELSKQMKELV